VLLVCISNRTETARREQCIRLFQSFVLTKQDRYRLRCAYEGEKVFRFEEIRNRYVTRAKYGARARARVCVCVCKCARVCTSFWIFIHLKKIGNTFYNLKIELFLNYWYSQSVKIIIEKKLKKHFKVWNIISDISSSDTWLWNNSFLKLIFW